MNIFIITISVFIFIFIFIGIIVFNKKKEITSNTPPAKIIKKENNKNIKNNDNLNIIIPTINITPSNKKYSISNIRKKNKNAYKKWSLNEDKLLMEMYNKGSSISELSQYFERQSGGIRSRLKKLKLLN
jgi:regulatory protein YycI of two-component signal transduction system YycFG